MPSLSTGLKIAALLIGIGIPAIVSHTLNEQYARAVVNAESLAASIARTLEHHTGRTIDSTDAYLRSIGSIIGAHAGELTPEIIHSALREYLERSPHLKNLLVIDREGRVLIEGARFPARPSNVGDRDYFQTLRDHPGSGLVVGRAVVGRLSGTYVVPIARRVVDRNGSFAGIVQAGLDPASLQAAYETIRSSPGAMFSLWRDDGTLLMRSPPTPESIGKNFASSANHQQHALLRDTKPFWASGSTDGSERVIAYGFFDRYPLYVSATLRRADVLAGWRQSAIKQSSLAGGLTIVVVLALLLLSREFERRRRADATIRLSEASYRLLADNTTDVIIWSDLSTSRHYVSPAAKDVLGYDPAELVGTRPLDFVHPDDLEAYRAILDELTQCRIEQTLTCQRYRHKDGHWVWLEASFKLTRSQDSGEATGYVASLRDVTARKNAEEALRLSQERLALALDSGSDGLWDWNLTTGAVELSSHWFAMLGYEAAEIVPHIKTWERLVHPHDAERSRRLLHDHLKGLTPTYECEYRLRRKAGGYAWTLARGKVVARDGQGRPLRVVGTHIDITQRKEAEQQIAHMAVHDALTGLPNRLLFRERLNLEIVKARRNGGSFAVLACDLDHFKDVNDTLGHPAGDMLLRTIADRLRSVIRDGDTVARLGGDEFAIILDGPHGTQVAGAIAQRLIEEIGRPIELDGETVGIGTSVGIAFGGAESADADSLFKNADIALYRAKGAGRNTFVLYEPGMDKVVANRNLLERELREALRTGGLILHYQPILNLADDAPCGFEALVRWQHPQRGLIHPSAFVPLAEESGLIVPLGEWTLREACREAASWPGDLRVAVNVSAVQLQKMRVEHAVIGALAESGLAPNRLELEITESVLIEDSEQAIACLHRLRTLGVRIALDDFGTGYSSLSYLRRFPFDKIKIDRSFVRDIADPDTAAIVRAIVSIGERLGTSVLAEGVETAEQREGVRREGCTEVQGYLFSRPLCAIDARNFVGDRSRVAA